MFWVKIFFFQGIGNLSVSALITVCEVTGVPGKLAPLVSNTSSNHKELEEGCKLNPEDKSWASRCLLSLLLCTADASPLCGVSNRSAGVEWFCTPGNRNRRCHLVGYQIS